MARKASDLLDVFRLKPADPEGDDAASRKAASRKSGSRKERKAAKTGRGSSSSGSSSKRRRSGGGAGDEVVSVSRRQLVYAGSVVVLLMALSFTLGVSMSGDSGAQPALKKETPKHWYIVGYVSKTSLLADKKVDIRKAATELFHRFGVSRKLLMIHDLGTRYRMRLGPFDSKDEGYRYAERYQLSGFNHAGEAPFFPPELTQKPNP